MHRWVFLIGRWVFESGRRAFLTQRWLVLRRRWVSLDPWLHYFEGTTRFPDPTLTRFEASLGLS